MADKNRRRPAETRSRTRRIVQTLRSPEPKKQEQRKKRPPDSLESGEKDWLLDDFEAGLERQSAKAAEAFDRLSSSFRAGRPALARWIDGVVHSAILWDMKRGALWGRGGEHVPLDESFEIGISGAAARTLPGRVEKIAEQIERVTGSLLWTVLTLSRQPTPEGNMEVKHAHAGLPEALRDFAGRFEDVRRASRRATQKQIGHTFRFLFTGFGRKPRFADLSPVLEAHYQDQVSARSLRQEKEEERFSIESLEAYWRRYGPAATPRRRGRSRRPS